MIWRGIRALFMAFDRAWTMGFDVSYFEGPERAGLFQYFLPALCYRKGVV